MITRLIVYFSIYYYYYYYYYYTFIFTTANIVFFTNSLRFYWCVLYTNCPRSAVSRVCVRPSG